jgi:hypothetical protein
MKAMGSNILLKYMKSNWKSEDFGRGKSKVAKARHRRSLKRKANRELLNDLNK